MVDEALAIPKVQEFLSYVQALDGMWDPASTYLDRPDYRATKESIDKSVYLIKSIAEQTDPTLVERITNGLNGLYGYSGAVSATRELLGLLETAEERETILGPKGPKLAATNMHPWVWKPAAPLWDGGHHTQAVQTAASSIFDAELPGKLGLQQGAKGTKPEEMVGKAFDETSPILKIPGYTQGTQNWTNVYQGTKYLGLACAKLVRNLGTHNVLTPGDEAELLEELAMLSRFARIVDSSTL